MPAGLSLSTSGAITGTPTGSGGPTTFTVEVVDSVGVTATESLSITIVPAPVITTTSPLPNGDVSVTYSQTLVVSGGIAPYTWSVLSGALPAGLSLSTSGAITGTPTASGGPTTITFKVVDSVGGTTTKSLSITIVPALVITTLQPLLTGDVNVAYSQTLAVSGGIAPYTWSIQSGSLPSGLLLTPSGEITGTPLTLTDSTAIIFKVSDNVGGTAIKSLSITIMPTPAITTSSSLAGGEVGITYLQTLAVSGGTAPYTWSITSGTLPTGLSLNSSGTITGTPTISGGPTGIVIEVTDNAGGATTKGFSITIVAAPSVTTTSPIANGAIGVKYSQTLAVSGGTAPFIWSIKSGALPLGLSLNSNGVIMGTPSTSGNFTATLSVTDSFVPANTASKTFSLKIFLRGDANEDGVVNMADVTKVERVILGYDLQTCACDANGDGAINMGDVTKIERLILGLDTQ